MQSERGRRRQVLCRADHYKRTFQKKDYGGADILELTGAGSNRLKEREKRAVAKPAVFPCRVERIPRAKTSSLRMLGVAHNVHRQLHGVCIKNLSDAGGGRAHHHTQRHRRLCSHHTRHHRHHSDNHIATRQCTFLTDMHGRHTLSSCSIHTSIDRQETDISQTGQTRHSKTKTDTRSPAAKTRVAC